MSYIDEIAEIVNRARESHSWGCIGTVAADTDVTDKTGFALAVAEHFSGENILAWPTNDNGVTRIDVMRLTTDIRESFEYL